MSERHDEVVFIGWENEKMTRNAVTIVMRNAVMPYHRSDYRNRKMIRSHLKLIK